MMGAFTELARLEQSGRPFVEQPFLSVNALLGDDGADGVTTPLKTLAELERRLEAPLSPNLPTCTVTLTGAFDEQLILEPTYTRPNQQLIVQGVMGPISTGQFATYTAFDPTTDVRAQVTDGGANFSGQAKKRVRMTTGLQTDSVTNVLDVGSGGSTSAFIGQFFKLTPIGTTTLSTVNPVATDKYALETWLTSTRGYDVRPKGPGVTVLRDLEFAAPLSTDRVRSMSTAAINLLLQVYGCYFSGAGQHTIGAPVDLGCCVTDAATMTLGTGTGLLRTLGFNIFNRLAITNMINVLAQSCQHIGGPSQLNVADGAILEDLAQRGFFGVTGAVDGDAIARIRHFAKWNCSATGSIIWGSGNSNSYGVRIQSDSAMTYVTTPKLTGGTVNDSIIGGTAKSWADLGGAGFFNTANGAMIVPRV
jgi:hypothetical protein